MTAKVIPFLCSLIFIAYIFFYFSSFVKIKKREIFGIEIPEIELLTEEIKLKTVTHPLVCVSI